jgi:hypothetical protein
MESFFNSNIETYIETENVLYNIINSQDPQQIFLYGIIIVIITFISTKIIYNSNILIGLIFCSLIIYYLYVYRKNNILSDTEIFKDKFNMLYTKNQILIKYPKIIDFLFYMENFKYINISEFNNLISFFENFCKLYEYCLINYNLIFQNYQTLVNQKINILNQINNFIFITYKVEYENILIKQKIAAEEILNNLLNNLVILYKKKIYYDGYNNNINDIDYSNILPHTILNDVNYREHYDQYNISNLLFF